MTVTIAIPFAGGDEASFRLAIRSVFAQTDPDWRLLLVDDGADESLVRAAWSIDDPRITLLSDARKRGLPARLNQISAVCETDLLFRMDADDVMLPHRVACQRRFLTEHPEVDVCGGQVVAIDEHDGILGFHFRGRRVDTPKELLTAAIFWHPTVAGRTEWFREHQYEPSIRWAEDKELWLRTRDSSTFRILDEPLLLYRTPLTFNRAKSLRTLRADFEVTWPYAKEWLGPVGLAGYGARLAAKAAVYSVGTDAAWRAKVMSATTHRSEAEAAYGSAQRAVSATAVPGWPDVAPPKAVG